VLTNKRRRNVLKDLVKVLQQENYTYRDPITEFLEDLYVNFDFEAAQVKLRLCERVLENDFFLRYWIDFFGLGRAGRRDEDTGKHIG
jgi:translation initiation factor 3 subunit E